MSAKPPLAEPQRIALVKPSALGDIMNSLPVLAALRSRFPGPHQLDRQPLLRAASARPSRSRTRQSPSNATSPWARPYSGLSAMIRFIKDLRRRRFDLVIDLQGLFRTGLIAYLSGAKRRVGLASAREGAAWFYTELVDDLDGSPHAVDRCWRVAEHFGAADQKKTFRLPVDPAATQWALGLLAEYPRPWLAVGVGSRWLTKRWPPQHFAELARRVRQSFGGSVILIGAPDEADLARHTADIIDGPGPERGRHHQPDSVWRPY